VDASEVSPPTPPETASFSGGGADLIDQGPALANWIKKIIIDRDLAVKMRGKSHVMYEGWKMLAEKIGYNVTITSSQYVELGPHSGFETSAALWRDGDLVCSAGSGCFTDESKWAKSALFSIKSMAETRVAAKVIRLHLGWVMVLAGYSPTPFEELRDALEHKGEAPSDVDSVRLGLLSDIRRLMDGDREYRPEWLDKEIKTKKLRGQGYIWRDALGDPYNERTQVVAKYINGCMFMLNDKSEDEKWDIGDFSDKSEWPLWALPMKFVHILIGWDQYERTAGEDTGVPT